VQTFAIRERLYRTSHTAIVKKVVAQLLYYVMSQGLSDSLAPIFYFFSVPFRNPWRYRADVLHDRAELRFRRVPNTGHPSASDQASRRILILLRRKYLCSLRQIILRVLHLEEELMSSISRVNLGSLTKIGKDELQSLKARMVQFVNRCKFAITLSTKFHAMLQCYAANFLPDNSSSLLCCDFPSSPCSAYLIHLPYKLSR
jgi:hypothetical protein